MQQAFHVSGSSIFHSSESDESLFADPRGIFWMFEEPKPWAKYIMGCDPTTGITGWTRGARREGDEKVDNAAIEIFRVDAIPLPLFREDGIPDIDPATRTQRFRLRDLQVGEYAAPIDAVEIAQVCNLLGRIYAGDQEDQCELIHEAYPGPGILTTQELLRLGYANLWYWEYIDAAAEETDRIGWHSTRESQKLLWNRSRRHLMLQNAMIRSKWLVDEYANSVIDLDKMRAKAAYGYHDDRLQAANMCYWAGHKWTYNAERTNEPVTAAPEVDWQHRAPTLGDSRSYRDAWADAIDGWG
jgi:hypothetical protein